MVANGGAIPNVVEYDVDFPVPAAYTLNVYYAAQNARHGWAVSSFALALTCKESAVAIAPLLLALSNFKSPGVDRRQPEDTSAHGDSRRWGRSSGR